MKAAAITGAVALERVMTEPIGRPVVLVSRKCPACFKRGRHWGNYAGRAHRIRCQFCAHEWDGRILDSEQR